MEGKGKAVQEDFSASDRGAQNYQRGV